MDAVRWEMAIVLLRRFAPPMTRRWGPILMAELFMWLVIAKTLANMVLMISAYRGVGEFTSPVAVEAWHLGSHILTGLAMAAFGITIHRPLPSKEPPVVWTLMRWYGTVAILLAPIGLVERAVELIETTGITELAAHDISQASGGQLQRVAICRALIN